MSNIGKYPHKTLEKVAGGMNKRNALRARK